MEEDKKVLEEFIEEYNASYPEEKEWVAIYPNQIQAIENLIKEYKELKKLEDVTIETLKDTNYIHNNYIPKSKVREKIEEYNKMINATYGDITHQGDIRRDNCIEIRNILQELLQEGDKDETKM